ncbi:MAG: DUF5693 family protein [Clostridiales bacterium]
MLNKKWKTIILIIIAVAMAAAIYIGVERSKVESDNNAVEIVSQWDTLVDNGKKDGFSPDEVLKECKGSVTSFIFKEMTIEDLKTKNLAVGITGIELRSGITNGEYDITAKDGAAVSADNIDLNFKYLWLMDKSYSESLATNLAIKSNAAVKEYTVNSWGKNYTLIGYNDISSELSELGLVFDINAMKKANANGFYAIPRFTTWANYTHGDMAMLTKDLADVKCSGIMFNDKTVANVDNDKDLNAIYKDMAKGLKPLNAPVIMVEFYNQKGLDLLAKAYDLNMVRMHSIADNELTAAITPDVAFNRYMLAVNERNIRVIYLKPFPGVNFSSMIDYGKSLTAQLEKDGFTLDRAEPLREMPENNLTLILIALGIGGGSILLGEKLRLLKLSAILSVLLVFGSTALAVLGHYVLAAKILALLAAVVFPTLGIITWVGGKQTLGKSLLTFLKISGVTLVGASFIVGLLSLKTYMYSIDIFSGVKVAMLLPLLLVFYYCVFLKEKQSIFDKAKGLSVLPVRYGELLILGILGVAMIVLLLRSGNDGLQVSSLELAFRTKLEDLLMVRPRTKEFLIGTPCLLMAIYFGYKDYLVPLWLLGAIGQVSMLNTFCHFHTPLFISLFRTFNGIWIGLLLGCIAIFIIRVVMKKFNTRKL